MGLLTLQELRGEVNLQRSVGNTLKDRWINQALKEFGYAFKFHELEASAQFQTVDAQFEYEIGSGLDVDISDFRYVEELRRVDSVSGDRSTGRILPETRSKFILHIGDTSITTSHGNPKYYHRWRNALVLRPVPDSDLVTLEMDYYKTITALGADGDKSPFHEDWDEAIITGALYRGFRHFGEFDRYQNVRNDFLGLVRSRQLEYDLEEFPEGSIDPNPESEEELSSR